METVKAYVSVATGVQRAVDLDLASTGQADTVGRVPPAAQPYVTVVETGNSVIRKTVLTCTALPLACLDDAGVAQYGGAEIYKFPEGLLCTMGAVIAGAMTGYASIIATFTGVVALGTATAGVGATLVGTEADILQSVALTQAVAKVANSDSQSIATALTEAGSRWLDGTPAAKSAYLNLAIADDVAHGAGNALFTGTISIVWLIIGDN